MAVGHDGLLHEVLGLLANLFLGCPPAQKAYASSGNPSLLQRTLNLIFKPSLDLSTFQVQLHQVPSCRLLFHPCGLEGILLVSSRPCRVTTVVQRCSNLPMLPCSTGSTTLTSLTSILDISFHLHVLGCTAT